MIPNVDRFGNQNKTVPWLGTKADKELSECKALRFSYASREWPVWKFMEAYCLITDKKGEVSAFAFNDAQIATYKEWERQYAEKGWVRFNIGKGRQMGTSTLIEGFGFSMMVTHPGFHIGILADTENKGKGLLQKYKFFYQNLPKPFKEQLMAIEVVNSSSVLAFDFGNGVISSVEVIVANENAGASKTFQMLHCSEVALWQDIGMTLTALERTVGNVENTFIFRETTARGPNEWKVYYEDGKSGRGRFRSIFLPWYVDTGYKSKYDNHDLIEYERMLRDELHLSLEQIQWWAEEWHACGKDLAKMKQEFPSTEAEMWQSTSISIFDSAITEKRKQETEGKWLRRFDFEYLPPVYESEDYNSSIAISEIAVIEDYMGFVTVFEEPIQGHPYAMVNDPANGGDDYHATHIIDCSNDRQVAVYHRKKVDADESVFQSYCLWRYYKFGPKKDMDNRVYISGERNLTTYWLHMMERLGAGPISMDRQDNETQSVMDQLGWRTTPSNRQKMIDEFKIAFRESNGTIINDYETLCEMETFQYQKFGITQKEKAMALKGEHDDLVMAYAGYFHCKNRGDFECNVIAPRKANKQTVDFDPMRRNLTKRSDRFQEW